MRRLACHLFLLSLVCCACARDSSLQVTGLEKSSSHAPARMVYAATVKNLAVDARLLKEGGARLLQLHVTWQLPTEGRKPTKLILQVLPRNYTGCPQDPGYCPDGFIYEIIEDTRTSSVSVPRHPREDPFRITPECCYEVKMESSPHNGKIFASKNFTAPECIKDVCSCRKSQHLPVPNITSVVPLNNGSVQVSWLVQSTEGALASSNITRFTIRFGEEALRSNANLVVFNTTVLTAVPWGGRKEHSLVLDATLRQDREYSVEVAVEDRRRCHGRTAKHIFHGGLFKEENMKKEHRKMLVMPVALVACVLLAGVCLALAAVLMRSRWQACVKRKLGLGSAHAPDSYKAVSINSDVTKFSDIIRSALHERNVLYVEAEIEEARQHGLVDGFEVSQQRLRYVRELGEGAFGRVFLAQAEALAGLPGQVTVAVKTLKSQASEDETEEFLAEIAMMKRVGRHANIVTMLGCCTLTQPYCMVMEFVPCGDLLKYLHVLRAEYQRLAAAGPKYLELMLSSSDSQGSYIFPGQKTIYSSASVFTSSANTNSHSSVLQNECSLLSSNLDITADVPVHGKSRVAYVLDSKELENFALQVARGMAYLEQKQITHRDLAARNVLIDGSKTLKISDFGMSRSGVYVNMRHKKVPLRWLSIEAIQENLYSSKSDVWAFAVVLWEIGTLGAFPYPTVGDYRLLPYLLEGRRLEKPDNCTKELYALMQQCWSESADERPSFIDIVSSLESMTFSRHVYVDFGSLERGYTFPPTEDEIKSR